MRSKNYVFLLFPLFLTECKEKKQKHTHKQQHTHTHTCIYVRAHTPTPMHACTCTCTCACTHARTHARTHTHTHTHTHTQNTFLTDTLICTLLKSFVTHENLSKLVMIATVWGNSKMTSTGKGEGEEVVKNGDKKWQKRDGVIQYSDVNHSVFYPDHSVYYFIFITYNSCCLLYHFFRF